METHTQTPPADDFNTGKLVLSWRDKKKPVHERSKRWFMIGGSIAALFIIVSLILGDWSFALVTAAIAVAYVALHRTPPPPESEIAFYENGVMFEQVFTRYSNIQSFWILNLPSWNEVHIMKKTGLIRKISIHTGDIPLPQIRASLSQFMTEDQDRKERSLDRFIRIFKL